MYVLNIVSAIKNMTFKELKYFIFENCWNLLEKTVIIQCKIRKKRSTIVFNKINRKII